MPHGQDIVMRASRRMLKQVRRAVLAAFAFSGFVNLLLLVVPVYVFQAFQNVVPQANLDTLLALTLMAAAAIVTLTVVDLARRTILLRAGLWLDHELGRHMLDNGLRASEPGRELRQDAQALERVRDLLASGAIVSVLDLPWLPVFVMAVFLMHPLLGIAATASALLLAAAALMHAVLTGRLDRQNMRAKARRAHWLTALTDRAPLGAAAGFVRAGGLQWDSANRAHVVASYELGKRTSLMMVLARAIAVGAQVGLYGLGAWLVVRGQLAPGMLVAAAILLERVLAPMTGLVQLLPELQRANAGYRRLQTTASDVALPEAAARGHRPAGRVQLNGAGFRYEGRKRDALSAIDLGLAPGQCLAIVGGAGAGKSTLAALVAGALRPTSGSADLDAVPLVAWQTAAARPPVGYAPDEPRLLDGSVHDNIASFAVADRQAVVGAAQVIGVDTVLEGLPRGFDTPVGHGGYGLAQRERRAVALARAVYGSPRLLVLDEPETGLDGDAIQRLAAGLARLKASGAVVVLVTRDRHLMRLADTVAILEAGRLLTLADTAEVLAPREEPPPVLAVVAGGRP